MAEQMMFEFAATPAPPRPKVPTRQDAERMLAEFMQGTDPAEIRMPQVGDEVEVLWTHYWTRPWARGTVVSIWNGIMTVRMHGFDRRTFWTPYVTWRDRARNPNIDKGEVWRWPQREEETA